MVAAVAQAVSDTAVTNINNRAIESGKALGEIDRGCYHGEPVRRDVQRWNRIVVVFIVHRPSDELNGVVCSVEEFYPFMVGVRCGLRVIHNLVDEYVACVSDGASRHGCRCGSKLRR